VKFLLEVSCYLNFFSLGVTAEALRANISSAISLQWGPVDPKFQVEWVAFTNHSSSQKTRLNDLSYNIEIWTDFSSVFVTIYAFDRRRPRLCLQEPGHIVLVQGGPKMAQFFGTP